MNGPARRLPRLRVVFQSVKSVDQLILAFLRRGDTMRGVAAPGAMPTALRGHGGGRHTVPAGFMRPTRTNAFALRQKKAAVLCRAELHNQWFGIPRVPTTWRTLPGGLHCC